MKYFTLRGLIVILGVGKELTLSRERAEVCKLALEKVDRGKLQSAVITQMAFWALDILGR